MSNWILYDDFVDLVRNQHHEGFSGLITGVSDTRHSFQVGFDRGEVVLLNYRIKKGMAALQLMTQIERAKITLHPTTEVPGSAGDVPDTSTILSRLTANTLDETGNTVTDIKDVPQPRRVRRGPGQQKAQIDAKLRQIIETAAIHHFGPIGAMVCEEHLQDQRGDVRAIMLAIAQDVGANEADTQAFFQSVSNA